jgi:hypothetical protein
MPVKAKPFGCSQKALAALTALPLHADLKVAMAKGRQPYRLASGGAQAQRLEHRQLKKTVLVSLKSRFIYPLETAMNLICIHFVTAPYAAQRIMLVMLFCNSGLVICD